MRSRRSVNPIAAGVLVALCMALAACGEPTRIATLNDTTQIPGTRVATTVQQQLAKQGYPKAGVSCVKTIIVNVGPAVLVRAHGRRREGNREVHLQDT